MTLRLILTRHAKSDWASPAQDDHDRPLNARGQHDAPRIGRWLAAQGIAPGQALCSTARRTLQTAAALMGALPDPPPISPRAALYHASAATMLDELRRASAPVVLMIGHNPGIAAFADLMAREAPDHPRWDDYPTAATAILDFDIPDWSAAAPGSARVAAYVIPHDLP